MSWYSCKNFHECTQVCTYKLLSSRSQGRSQGGAQGARAPPLSCRAMTSYERRLATRVVTLASCKLELTVLELVVATIYHAAHINQQHGFILTQFGARGRTLRYAKTNTSKVTY